MRDSRSAYFFLVLFMLPFAGAGVDIYTPSLPALTHYFSTTPEYIKYTVTVYLLGLCVGQIVYGTISDFYGRRPTLLFSLVGFIGISYLITHVTGVHQMIVARLFQGFFMGGVASNARSIISDVYTKEEIHRIVPCMAASWSLGPIVAPVVGGYLQHYCSWHLSFDVLAVYAFLLLIAVFLLQESNTQKKSYSHANLVHNYVQLFKSADYLGGFFSTSVGYFMLLSYAIILPFVVQHTLHQSAVVYGNATLLIGVAYLSGTLLNRFLQHYMSVDLVIKRGMISITTLSIFMCVFWLSIPLSMWVLYLPILLLTVGVGVVFPSCMSKCLGAFPDKAGIASAVAGAGFMLTTAVLSTLMSYFHFKTVLDLSFMFVFLSSVCLFVRWWFFVKKADLA